MPPLRVTCQNCQRITVVDSEKVPDQPVSYRCPSCQSKVTIDKRKLLAGDATGVETPPAGAAASASAAATAHPTREPGHASSGSLIVPSDALLEMALPPGESLPPGLLVAEDREAGAQLKRWLEPYDCTLEPMADAAAARELALTDPPPLLVYVADAVTKPPYAPLEPLVTIPPRERRRSFVVLVASNVKTLDGNLAFLYQVDLLLNRQHLSQAPGIFHSALRAHHRMYKPFFAALAEQ